LIGDAIDRSRGLSRELSPPLLSFGGLDQALQGLAQQMRSTCGLTVRVEAKATADPGSEVLRSFVYKAAREMLFNVVKHARVKQARLQLRRRKGQILLTVSDQGRGFDPSTLAKGSGFGLFSVQERAQLLGGWMKRRNGESAKRRSSPTRRFADSPPLLLTPGSASCWQTTTR
jgi:signal transduction histidine kinase